jgi:hypothetical protein
MSPSGRYSFQYAKEWLIQYSPLGPTQARHRPSPINNPIEKPKRAATRSRDRVLDTIATPDPRAQGTAPQSPAKQRSISKISIRTCVCVPILQLYQIDGFPSADLRNEMFGSCHPI